MTRNLASNRIVYLHEMCSFSFNSCERALKVFLVSEPAKWLKEMGDTISLETFSVYRCESTDNNDVDLVELGLSVSLAMYKEYSGTSEIMVRHKWFINVGGKEVHHLFPSVGAAESFFRDKKVAYALDLELYVESKYAKEDSGTW